MSICYLSELSNKFKNTPLKNLQELSILPSSSSNQTHSQCRFASLHKDISIIKPGNHCEIYVEGSGLYTSWYYYHFIDGRHGLMFRKAKIIGELTEYSYYGFEIPEPPYYDAEKKKVHFYDGFVVNGIQHNM